MLYTRSEPPLAREDEKLECGLDPPFAFGWSCDLGTRRQGKPVGSKISTQSMRRKRTGEICDHSKGRHTSQSRQREKAGCSLFRQMTLHFFQTTQTRHCNESL